MIHYSTDADNNALNGQNSFDGEGGVDTVDFSLQNDGSTANAGDVVVTLNTINDSSFSVNGVDGGVIRNVENIIGGSGDDTITGDTEANSLKGGAVQMN